MKKKIYLHLSGGIGNQLFQYAAAKNLSLINNTDLVLDTFTGFVTDFKFKRKFSLNHVDFKKVKFAKVFLFAIFRLIKKIFFMKRLFYQFFGNKLIDEYYYFEKFHTEIKNLKFKKNLYMLGLFQSEKYFYDNKNIIIKEILPKEPKDSNYRDQVSSIDNNAIAICVRAFEDLPINLSHTVGGLTEYSFFENSLKIFLDKIDKPKLYFFSTNQKNIFSVINNIKLFEKYEKKIITKETGFKNDINTLWLISNFKNLIISNSTFYWWGAYFACSRYDNTQVISASQFPNKDTNLKSWTIT
jgi:hypothetical protein